MAISTTQTNSTTTAQEVRKTHNTYDNLDNLKAVVHYDANNNVDYVLKTSNNASGKSSENTKFQQIQIDVIESPSNISFSSATLKARIYKNDNSKVRETGFVVWAGNDLESVVGKTEYSNVITTPVVLKGNFTKAISNLSDSTTYNYRAYVKHEYGTNYSKVYQFTTIASNLVFAISGNKFSGPAPLTVSLSAINAGGGVSSYAWNLTGGTTPQFTAQTVNYTYLSAGTFTARASAIMGSGTIKTATRQIIATGTTNYTAEWSNVLASSYGNNIVGAYDFRNISNSGLKNGLLAFWKLDTLSWLDSLGNNTLSDYGNVEIGTGIINGCLLISEDGYLQKSSNNFDIGTGNISISVWIKPLSHGTGGYDDFAGSIFDFRDNEGGKEWLLIFNDIGKLRVWQTPTSYESSATIGLNQWTHIVLSRNNGVTSLYINGSLDGTFNDSENFVSQIFTFGGPVDVPDDTNYLHYNGNIDAAGIWNRALTEEEIDLLYNSGTGTENVGTTVDAIVGPDLSIVGTTQIESLSGDGSYNYVSLLLDMSGSNGSTNFIDKSTNSLSVTANGSTQIASITGVGSPAAYFDGNGDYLRGNVTIDYSGNFTIEGWFNRTGVSSGQLNTIFEAGNIQISQGGIHLYVEPNTEGTFVLNNGITAADSGGASPLNQWVHFAVVRNGGTNTLYVNGVSVSTSNQSYLVNNNIFSIGGAPNYGFYVNGYIDGFRITEGVARYTANFIPPSGPLPTTSDPDFGDVQLLLNMNSVGTTFTDQSNNNLTITRFGTPAITSNAPAFSRSNFAVFDGNVAKYLSLNSGQNFNFSNDFTIEGWFLFKQNDVGYQPLITSYVDSDQTGWILCTETGNWLAFYGSQDNSWQSVLTTSYVPPVGQWLHIAVSRVNGLLQMFVNGESVGSTSEDTTNIASGNTVAIGQYEYFPDYPRTFNGYIDDVRITKGVGRYASSFTPPQSLPTEVGEIVGLKFIPSPAYAESNETISVTYPHTLVYVGKCDAISAPAETILLATQPDKNDFNTNQVNMVFTRPNQSLMPYNGLDNEETGYLPDGSEWFYAAFSFLSNNTVRYAVYSPTQTLSGTLDGSSSKQNYNGFITIGAGFGDLPQYNVFGTVRACMFINQAFTTQTNMENLYNDIISGPVTNLGL